MTGRHGVSAAASVGFVTFCLTRDARPLRLTDILSLGIGRLGPIDYGLFAVVHTGGCPSQGGQRIRGLSMILRYGCRQFAVLGVLVLAIQPAPAQTFTWDGGLSHGNFTFFNTWTTPNNWVGGAAPVSGAATSIVFTQSGIWTTADQNVANPFVLNSMYFNGANNFTALSDQPLQFTFSTGSPPGIGQNTPTAITIGNAIMLTSNGISIGGVAAGSLTLSGNISGPGFLILESSGTIVLTGNNSYTGETRFESGIIQAGNSGALSTGRPEFLRRHAPIRPGQ